ncbi:Sporulation kinase E [Posidoniimonas polymericola]|uniref:histidine kinase n=2 Tax=Posidoniimonas polymericola TaxID=2528002 RepID=A0A5C5YT56_9BACT|nr:Sporulation kinase E [Posidoniimonas polymericola]
MGPACTTDNRQADYAFRRELYSLQVQTDRLQRWLLLGQWVFAAIVAAWISPRTWQGEWSSTHVHLWAALVLGGLLVSLPWALISLMPGARLTRLVVAAAQAGFSVLLIHLMGGRIEAHFHIFGALALLSFYRDPLVYLPAVAIVVVDHVGRGLYWPESIFGVNSPSFWRALEHAGWVLFEVVFLLWGVMQSRHHLLRMSQLQHSLQSERDNLEQRVAHRTAELDQSRRYAENVLDSLDARICILDYEGVIVSTNRAWDQLESLGVCEPTSLTAGLNYIASCQDCAAIGRDDLGVLADATGRVICGELTGHVQEFKVEPRGETRWIQARVSPFLGDQVAAAVVTHVDITERVQALKQSHEESRRAASLSKILRESPNEIYVFRRDTLAFIENNEGAERRSGYTRQDLAEMTPLDLMPDLDREALLADLATLDGKKIACVQFQTEMAARNGHRTPVQVVVHQAVFEQTPVYVAFVADLSQTRALEHKLAQAQKLESLGQLAAGIAHEINTPMQCIASNMEFLDGSYKLLDPICREMLTAVELEPAEWATRQAVLRDLVNARLGFVLDQAAGAVEETAGASQRVVEIVRAMKAMSHPGAREKSAADVNEIIRQAATITRNRWKYVAEMQLELAEPAPVVPLLAAEMSQVLLNLIVNAADAIVDRYGELPGAGKITVRTESHEEYVRIEVSDNGAGMSEAVRRRIFEPFFTTKDVGKGTGQGLAIAYDAVVNKHQGTIELTSTPGDGTTFIVCLPAGERQTTEAEGSPGEEIAVQA